MKAAHRIIRNEIERERENDNSARSFWKGAYQPLSFLWGFPKVPCYWKKPIHNSWCLQECHAVECTSLPPTIFWKHKTCLCCSQIRMAPVPEDVVAGGMIQNLCLFLDVRWEVMSCTPPEQVWGRFGGWCEQVKSKTSVGNGNSLSLHPTQVDNGRDLLTISFYQAVVHLCCIWVDCFMIFSVRREA